MTPELLPFTIWFAILLGIFPLGLLCVALFYLAISIALVVHEVVSFFKRKSLS